MRALVLAALLLAPLAAAAPAPLWTSSGGPGDSREATAVAIDAAGLVVVVGGPRAWALNADGAVAWTRLVLNGPLDRLADVAAMPDGDTVVAGTREDGGGADGVVARLHPDGSVRWTTSLEAGGREALHAVAVDASGDVVVAGASENISGFDVVVAKVGGDGTRAWTRTVHLDAVDEAFAITILPDGTIVAAGRTLAGADSDALLVGLSPDGDVLWTRRLAGEGIEELRGVAALPDGSLVTTGTHERAGRVQHALARHAADGAQLWARNLDDATGRDLAVDAWGGVVAVGTTGMEGRVLRLDADGTEVWDVQVRRGHADVLLDVAVGPDGRVAAAGYTQRDESLVLPLVLAYPQRVLDPRVLPEARVLAGPDATLDAGADVASAWWDLGDGRVVHGANARSGYEQAGTYDVVVRGRTVDDALFVAAGVVIVEDAPVVPAGTASAPPEEDAPRRLPVWIWVVPTCLLAAVVAGFAIARRRLLDG